MEPNSTSRHDASAPLLADGAIDAVVIEIEGEGFGVFIKRSLKWFFFDWVERDEVDIAKDAAESFRELLRAFDGIVQTLDENVLEGDATAALFDVFLDRVKKDVHVIRPRDRHELIPDLVVWSVERDSQVDLDAFITITLDAWDETAGADGDVSCSDR